MSEPSEPSPNPHVEQMRRLLCWLIDQIDRPVTLEQIAHESGYSPFHVHRLFRGVVGEPALSLLRRLRLERAALALRDRPERSITQVAFDAGYETHEAFTRAFAAAFGRSPSAFRRHGVCCVWLAGESNLHVDDAGEVRIPTDWSGHLKKETTMELRVENRSPVRIAYVAGVGPYQKVLPESFAKLCAVAHQRGLFARPGAVTLAVCHDDPETTPPEQIRSEAAITVDESFDPAGELQVRMLTGGRYAVVTHLGPYSGLSAAWQEFTGTLIPQAKLTFRPGDCFEVYINDPRGVSPDQIRTDLFMPVA